MRNRINMWMFILVISLTACKESSTKAKIEQMPKNLVDRIHLEDLQGNEITLGSLAGKTIFLNFWATWCRPCLAEMPDIDKAAKLLSEDNYIFLAASDESLEKIKIFADKNDYSFQFVHSITSVFDLDISALPTTIIINKNGEIVYNKVGAKDWASEFELSELRKLSKK